MTDVDNDPSGSVETYRLLVGGQVQGVGFRPYVYRLAHQYTLSGWVRNLSGQVEIMVQGRSESLVKFADQLLAEAPPLAFGQIISQIASLEKKLEGFTILSSTESAASDIHVPPDYFVCDECLKEQQESSDRRYRYPFINCTQCGPRYTLISRLPYDRPHTTMAGFELCPDCQAEYENPLDRRFHAEPIACPACGPQLAFQGSDSSIVTGNDEALAEGVHMLREGKILAVKGIGGYHLMCDATNEEAVSRLRTAKHRPHKPLAVMFPKGDGLFRLQREVVLNQYQKEFLCGPMRPIVLLKKREDSTLPASISDGQDELGVMLPYSPLHHLLLNDFGGPVVATSANISGEPVLIDNIEVAHRLAHVADAFLHHDRTIARPADDPVFREIAGEMRPLRLGRGCTPLEITLPFTLSKPVLAVGAHKKNSVALAWDNRVVISPHIGDMGTLRSLVVFAQVVKDLQALYGVTAEVVVCDAHPGYATTKWANKCGLPVLKVMHHHAHASAVAGEFPLEENQLVFTWDGTGLGEDGALWGGEALLGKPGYWYRFATIKPFYLPGAEKAGREPWRSAAAVCWESGLQWQGTIKEAELLYQAWQRRINCPKTYSVGRLFDAAASLVGLLQTASFEGQGPMLLEAVAVPGIVPVNLPLQRNGEGIWESDWSPLLSVLTDESLSVAERAGCFHSSMVHALLAQAIRAREEHGIKVIGLSGGVFQNKILSEQVVSLLERHNFIPRLAERVPCNDSGICFGQIVEVAGKL
ncbi:carbamoyltransferase HypF [Sulfurirhabdus autotrophica]|uniref:Carbamoyltransferase HypF n=1 Tax=Sulfurirhabdus autotrophica TaxID=1706046 RepID=A0A4R3XTU3_9PROT|nr:carbamoyltransferase HypF [Sulfurirhabdus autotrophica]TCV80118.1 hydrogenase maturation carbamoyltransferase HypF [Sulfurirhabdus autotrophica]